MRRYAGALRKSPQRVRSRPAAVIWARSGCGCMCPTGTSRRGRSPGTVTPKPTCGLLAPTRVRNSPPMSSRPPHGSRGRLAHRLARTLPATDRTRGGTGQHTDRYGRPRRPCGVRPYRSQPGTLILARRLATLDRLSEGRLDVGVGQGGGTRQPPFYIPEEFTAAGVPAGRRGAGFVENLAAMRACWGPDPVEFHGEYYQIPKLDLPVVTRDGRRNRLDGGGAFECVL